MRYGTGISGFVGSHLSKKLDITAIPHEKLLDTKLKPFDYFYFLSSYGNLASQTEESEIYEANIGDLLYVLMQAKNIPFKSFVYMSSSSVKLRTQTTYSRTKKAAEEILLAVMEGHNLPICIIRPFSVTGVGEQNEHLIPTLIRSCLEGTKINFVPEPRHDFIDVEDVVAGIINLSEHGARGIFEFGTGKSYSNQEVLDIVEKVTGKKANINIVPTMRTYDTDNWVSTNFKSRGWGWMPQISLEESIRNMVRDYKEQVANQGV